MEFITAHVSSNSTLNFRYLLASYAYRGTVRESTQVLFLHSRTESAPRNQSGLPIMGV